MRDAQSLLDQIISFGGQEVVDEDVRDVLGFIPGEILDRTLDALAGRDSRALLENIGIVVDQGLNIQQYVREFISRIRDLLVIKLGLVDKVLGSGEEKRALAERAERFSEQDLIRFFDMLLRLESDLRWTSQARFHLEVGFVKLAKVAHVRDIEEVLREVKQDGGSPPLPPKREQRVAPQPAAAPAAPKPPSPPLPPTPPPAVESSFAETFIRRVEEKSGITAVYLQKAERIDRTENGIQVVMANSTHLAMLQGKEHKTVLDAAAGELFGKAISVSLIMKEQQQSNGPAAESVKEEPLVKRFLEVFKGDLAQVKPSREEQS
jgi:DNA polymerase-3 subunit gamma/tau